MKAIKAFLELFGKMVLSLAVIISIAFAIIAIIGMLKLGNEYKKDNPDNNHNQKVTIEMSHYLILRKQPKTAKKPQCQTV